MANRIDPRGLKTLLGTLREFGVTSYRDGVISIQFADAIPPQMGADVGAEDTGPPELPDGVLDPIALLTKLNRRKAAS